MGYYTDPRGKGFEGKGNADLGSSGDEWGVWALLAYIGAVAALVALLVHYDLIATSIYLTVLAFVLITPIVWGALPNLAVAFPLSSLILLSFGFYVLRLSFWPREEACLLLFSGGFGMTTLGIRIAWVRYFSPGPVPASQTPRVVFHWDS